MSKPMFQLGNPDTYINMNIYLYREAHTQTCIYSIHTLIHTTYFMSPYYR